MLDKALFCAIMAVLGGAHFADAAARAIPKMEFGMQEDYNKDGEIYRAFCRPTGKSYIGQSWDFAGRKTEHLRADGRCPLFSRAIRKHGADAFEWTIIGRATTQEGLDALERGAITAWGTLAPGGYNLTEGGGGTKGFIPTDMARQNMSISQKGRKHSAETRAKMSKSMRGIRKRPFSAETRAKMSAARLGKKHSAETRAKISTAKTGKKMPPVSAETRAKLSAAGKGRRHSAESIAKMSLSKQGKRQPWVSAANRARAKVFIN